MARPEGLSDVDRKARLERMIARDYRFVWRLLRRLGVAAQSVDDATQQVFLIASERLGDIREESERSFAFGTALRVAQTHRRRHVRELAQVQHDDLCTSGPDPEALAAQRRACEQLDRVLEQMPLELRSVFVLFELEGMTSPEIAQLAEVPLGTVASRLRRARERFRELVASGPELERQHKDEP
jgi:RNA polymerase sigma-70 factor (ECF subfamily)